MSRPAGKRAVALSAVLLPLLAACGGSGLIDGGGSGFEEGDTLPGYVHVIPRGSRADVQAKGRYDTGEWTVEICRLLDTGRSDDAKFIVGQETRFSLAVADNSGSVHNGASVVNLIWAGINDPSTVVVGDLAQVFEAAPVIDGDPSDSAWGAVQRSFIALAPQSGDNGITQALVQAGHRDGYLYLRISWDDPTRNDRSARWTRGANDWSRNGENEDRLFLMFDITGARGTATAGQANGTTTPFAQAGCAMACHGDGVMRTDSGRLDIWHWKATRTDPLGVLDDKQLVAAVSGTSGREGDEGDAGYIDNVDGTGIRPGWRSARGTDADPPALFLLGDEIDFKAQKVNDNGFVAGDILPAYVLGVPKNGRSDVWARGGFDNGRWSVEFRRALDSGATFAQGSPVRFRGGGPWQDGDTIPGYVTHPPEGSSADVQAEGAWAAAIWTVEIGRDLDTGRPDDVLFTPGTNLWMSLAVTDNSGGVHNGVPSVSLRWTGTASAFVVVSDPLGAQAPPIIDGDGTDPVWSTVQTSNVPLSAQAGGGNSINQLFVQSVRSATRIYFRFVWVDPTRDGTREQWTRSGGTWSRNSENEDRLFVMFDIDGALGTGTPGADDGMGTTPFAGVPGCTVLCHGDGVMRTDSGKVDIWHWKATRNNGSGWLDDRLADSSGRRADSGAGIATRNERAGEPAYQASADPGADAAHLHFAPRSSAPEDTGFIVGRTMPLALGLTDGGGAVHDGAPLLTLTWSGSSTATTLAALDLLGAAVAAPVVDGGPADAAWSAASPANVALTPQSGGGFGITQAQVQAAYDRDHLYLLVVWDDPSATRDITGNRRIFDGGGWSTSGARGEDRVFLLWGGMGGASGTATSGQANGTTTLFREAGCAMTCHGDGVMRTDSGRLDIWHWKATRSNGLAFADDKFFGPAASGVSGRTGDFGGDPVTDNGTPTAPAFQALSGPGASLPYLVEPFPAGSHRAIKLPP